MALRKIIFLLSFLFTGLAFGQTTVTLEDQCNCEVLSGPDVTAPGLSSPAGADLGDLYVNTNTGTIYFWDGDSWELTSTDANTTNASLSEDGVNLILTDSDTNQVLIPLADIAAAVNTNTTNVTFTVNTTNGTLDIIDSDNNTVFVDIADLVAAINTDNQNASEVAVTPAGNITSTDVQAALEELDADITGSELTTTVVEGSGTDVSSTVVGNNTEYTVSTEVSAAAGNALSVVGDGLFSTDDQNASEVAVTPAGNITSTDVQAALEELDADITGSELTTTVVEGSGTDVSTSVVGNNTEYTVSTEVSAAAGNALSVVGDGLFSTDTDDQNASEVAVTPAGNITSTDVQAALEELDADITGSELTTTVVEGSGTDVSSTVVGNNTEYTVSTEVSAAAGNALSVVGDGLFATDTDDQNASEVAVTPAGNITSTDVQAALEELDADITGSELTTTVVEGSGTDVSSTVVGNNTEYTVSTEVSAAVGNALSVVGDGLFATDTDDQDGEEVALDDTANNFTTDNVEAALAELAGRTDNDTQYTAGDGLNLTGTEFTAAISTTAGNALSIDANGLFVSNVDNVDDADADPTNELSQVDSGTPTATGATATNTGETYVDSSTGQLYVWDGSSWTQVGGSSSPVPDTVTTLSTADNITYTYTSEDNTTTSFDGTDNQDGEEVALDDIANNFTTDNVEAALAELAGRTDNDTQYTAGDGLNLTGTEFTADISGNAGNALSIVGGELFATDTDNQDGEEVALDDTANNFTTDNVEAALAELAGRTDNDTQYTAGDGLNLTGTEFTADISANAGNALSIVGGELFATDTNTQYTAGAGLDLTGTEFTADISTTAGNALSIDANGLFVSNVDNDTQYTAGDGLNLTGTEFTADISANAGNALSIVGGELFATDTDNQDGEEVALDDTANNFTTDNVEAALAELAGRTDNDTQYTAGDGLNLTGTEFTADISANAGNALSIIGGELFATDTNTQYTAGAGLDLTGTEFTADISTTAGNALSIDANGLFVSNVDNDTQYTAGDGLNLTGTEFTADISGNAGNALSIVGGELFATDTDTDDQDGEEVLLDDTANNFTTDNVEAALAELAGRTDNDTQYTAGDGLNLTGTEFTADISANAGNALSIVGGELFATDTNTEYTAGDGLNLTGTEFTAAISTTAGNALSIDANGLFVSNVDNVDDADADPTNELSQVDSGTPTATGATATNTGETYVDSSTGQLYVWDGSSWTQVGGSASPVPDTVTTLSTADNITYTYTSENNTTTSFDGTDDQDGEEVALDDTANNFTTDNVEAALAELAGRTDNDTQYTAGDGLNLTGTEFTADISGNAGNALSIVGGELFATDTDNQDGEEVALDDTANNFTTDNVEAALAELAGRTDNDTQYTAGDGLNLTGTEFTADISAAAGNALSIVGGELFATDTDTDDQDGEEVLLDDTANNFTTDNVEAALAELAGRTDNDTQYTAGDGLNLTGTEFTADISANAGNALSIVGGELFATDTDNQDGEEVALDDTANNFTTDNVEAALAELAGRTDNDTQYTAGDGLNLTGTEFTADISGNAGNALSIVGGELFATDTNTQYTAGAGLDLTGTEFTADISANAGNALSIVGGELFATDTDNQDGEEVALDDTANNFTTDNVEAALAELAGRTDNDTQYTAGDGLNLTGTEFTADISGNAGNALSIVGGELFATDTNTQYTAGDGLNLTGTEFTADISGNAGNALSIVGGELFATDTNTQYTAGDGLNLTGTEFTADISANAGNALSIVGGELFATDTDNQDGEEVALDDTANNFTTDNVEAALAELAGRTDNDTQYTAGDGLNLTGTEFTADISGNAGNALSIVGGELFATDTNTQYTAGDGLNLTGTEFTADISGNAGNALSIVGGELFATDTDNQDGEEVALDDTANNFTTDNVEAALAELAGRTDNDTQYTAGDGLNLTGTEFTADISGNAGNALSIVGGELFATDTNTQYTAGAGLDLTGTEFTADISTTAGNALSIDANGLFVSNVDNDTQYTAGDGLNLTGTEFTADISGNAGNALSIVGGELFATDDQTASEVNSDAPVDVDGDGTTETTVEDVIQDIAPITSKAARIFYPPSIAVDASTNGTFTIDLYAEYFAQYGSPVVGSTGAPGAVPTYTPTELYYYVTYADPTVFDTTATDPAPTAMTIDDNGELTYTVIGQPSDYNSLINVVFVVK
ncbi:hypothetical protein [Aurantibacter crassamenti]|uniref:hypothetical protein n=1 Tax=Aurantibacter crassamenti TaxID=1837375 RepID=UPI001EEE4F7B|nr:hypothetical protein [Aurantibacter crassamenti]